MEDSGAIITSGRRWWVGIPVSGKAGLLRFLISLLHIVIDLLGYPTKLLDSPFLAEEVGFMDPAFEPGVAGQIFLRPPVIPSVGTELSKMTVHLAVEAEMFLHPGTGGESSVE